MQSHARRRPAWPIALVICVLICCGGPARPYSVTLDPVADTWLDDDHHNYNYGTSYYLEVRADSTGPDASALVKFDISSLPSGAVITSATFMANYCTRTGFDSNDWLYIGVYAVEPSSSWPRPWVETEATWYNYDSSHLWDTEGCESIWYDREANYDDRIYIDYNTAFGYKSWNVTSRVQQWYAGTDVNRGWLMREESHHDPEGVTFYSREYSPGYRPKLVIDYTLLPQPDPMTWASVPSAVSTSSITMTATTATPPPITYYFTASGGGHSNGWTSDTVYTDTGLSANTKCGYKVKARDNDVPQHTTADSALVERYTLIPAPTGVHPSAPTATTMALAAAGSFPNLDQGLTGTQFATTDESWVGSWRANAATDTATGLTPNTSYTFKVRARNGDGIATAWSPSSPPIRTLAAQPGAVSYAPVTCQGVKANWSANGNPAGTEYYCEEVNTGRNSGWVTDLHWIATGLSTSTTYQFRVRARNADLVETAWTDLGLVTTRMSIGYVKTHLNPMLVVLEDKVITAVFNNGKLLFVQDGRGFGLIEGISGIAVRNPIASVPYLPGQIVTIRGQVTKNDPPYSQELILAANDIHSNTPQISPRTVLACSNRNCGGGSFGGQPGLIDNVASSPAQPSFGASMVGMLVRVTGKLNDGGLGGVGYFWVDDGSQLAGESNLGIRVNLSPLGGSYPPPLPQYVAVTGIMRCVVVEGPNDALYNIRELWPLAVDVVVE